MNDVPIIGGTQRRRLPDRRTAETQTIMFVLSNGQTAEYQASVGFDEFNRPREIFLFGAKDGSDMMSVLIDTAVALSVALQHGVSGTAMSRSLARIDGKPTSIVGAALDLLAKYEAEL
jgi:hypothetical protein